MATVPRVVEPPVQSAAIDAKSSTQFSQAWTEYNQSVADQINRLIDSAAVAASNNGITDGSDAAAGEIGEYLTASGSGVALANGVANTVVALTLTAGDWDVSGYVQFTMVGAASNHYGVSLDGTPGGELTATIPSGSGTQRLIAATVRRNVTADTAIALLALAGFSSGAVSAAGTISARRAR